MNNLHDAMKVFGVMILVGIAIWAIDIWDQAKEDEMKKIYRITVSRYLAILNISYLISASKKDKSTSTLIYEFD